MKKFLGFILIALTVVSCGKKKSSPQPPPPPQKTKPPHEAPKEETPPPQQPPQVPTLPQPSENKPLSPESNIDEEIRSTINQNLAAQKSNFVYASDEGPHFQLISRINKINLDITKPIPELNIETFTDTLKFKYDPVDQQGMDAQGITLYKYGVCSEEEVTDSKTKEKQINKVCDLKAQVFLKRNDARGFNQAFITISNEENPNAIGIVNIFFVQKRGKIIPQENLLTEEQKNNLALMSNHFIDFTKKHPEVIGEFYYVLEEKEKSPLATRFNLIMSNDTYDLTPNVNVTDYLHQPSVSKIPLDPPSDFSFHKFWSRMFGENRDKSYTSASEFNYIIEQRDNPAELKTLKVQAKLHSSDSGSQNDIPVILLLDFQ